MRAIVIGLAAAVAAMAAVPVLAQYQSQVPAGSYQRSCRNIQVMGTGNQTTLSADCQDTSGRLRTTTLFFRMCRGDIGNNNGTLTCQGAPAARPGRPDGDQTRPGPIPNGSWRESCTNGEIRGGTFRAVCTDRSGRRVQTEIERRTCRSDSFSNVNGRLVCDDDLNDGRGGRGRGGGRGPDLPDGEWERTCIDRRIEGQTISGRCLNSRGVRVFAQANVRDCPSNRFYNNDGRLFCERDQGRGGRGDGRGPGFSLPEGSWTQTCRDAEMRDRSILTARCRTNQGQYRSTTIDIGSCRRPRVTNDNGVLRCE